MMSSRSIPKWIIAICLLVQSTMARPVAAPSVPPNALYQPTFLTARESWCAGTAFIVEFPGAPAPLLVTCHHLFGPSGGLEKQLEPQDLPKVVRGVAAVSMQDDQGVLLARKCLVVADAKAMGSGEPATDLALFLIEGQAQLKPLHFADTSPLVGDEVFMYARLSQQPNPSLYRATVIEVTPDAVTYHFADKKIELRGTSGAPVLNAKGEVIAMNLGGGKQAGKLIGVGNPVESMRKRATDALKAANAK